MKSKLNFTVVSDEKMCVHLYRQVDRRQTDAQQIKDKRLRHCCIISSLISLWHR